MTSSTMASQQPQQPHHQPTAAATATAPAPDPHQNKAIQLLETEIHYLSLALQKLPKYSPEHSFLERKVSTAKSELEALREDVALTAAFRGPASTPDEKDAKDPRDDGGTAVAEPSGAGAASWRADRSSFSDAAAARRTSRRRRRRSSNYQRSAVDSRRRASDLSAKSAVSAVSAAFSRSRSTAGRRRSSLLSLRIVDGSDDDGGGGGGSRGFDIYDNSDVYLFQDDGDSGSFSMYGENDVGGSIFDEESEDDWDGRDADFGSASSKRSVAAVGGGDRSDGDRDDDFYEDWKRGDRRAYYLAATGSSFSGNDNARGYSAVDILQAPMPHQQRQREQQQRISHSQEGEQHQGQYSPLPHRQHQPHPLQSYHNHIQLRRKKQRQRLFYVFFVALSLLVTLLCAYFLVYRENKLKIFQKGKISTAGINIGNPNSQTHKHNAMLEGEEGDPCALFMVYIQLDRYGNETSWEIVQLLKDENVGSGTNFDGGGETETATWTGSASGESDPEQHRQHIQQQQKKQEKHEEHADVANYVEVASNAQENENAHLAGSGRELLSSIYCSVFGNFKFRYGDESNVNNNDDTKHVINDGSIGPKGRGGAVGYKVQKKTGKRKTKRKATYIHESKSNPMVRFLRRLSSKPTKPQRGNGIKLLSGGPYAYLHDETYSISDQEKTIATDICLPIGKYQFIIYDSAQNGICCQYGRGKYQLKLANGDHDRGRIVRPMSIGNFQGEMEVTEFLVGFDDFATDHTGDGTDNNHLVTASSSEITTSSSTTTHIPDDYNSTNEQEELVTTNEFDQSDIDINYQYDNGKSDLTIPNLPSGSSSSSNPIENDYSPSKNDTGTLPTNIATILTTIPNQDIPSLKTSKSYGILFQVEISRNSNPIAITGMDLYLLGSNKQSSTAHYEVWYKRGSWRESDYGDGRGGVSNKGFRKVSHGEIAGSGGSCRGNDSDVDGDDAGSGNEIISTGVADGGCELYSSIPEEDFEPIIFKWEEEDGNENNGTDGGERIRKITFWVTLTTNGLIVQDGEGEEDGAVQSSDENLTVYFGESVHVYPLQLADPQTDFHEKKGFIGRLRYSEVYQK
ncbi:hypothetical protein ACHAXS_003164 [Conticribra weissflogii]